LKITEVLRHGVRHCFCPEDRATGNLIQSRPEQ
jgi:hypothetical protein